MAEPILELTTSGPTKPPRGSRKTLGELTPQEWDAFLRLLAEDAAPTIARVEAEVFRPLSGLATEIDRAVGEPTRQLAGTLSAQLLLDYPSPAETLGEALAGILTLETGITNVQRTFEGLMGTTEAMRDVTLRWTELIAGLVHAQEAARSFTLAIRRIAAPGTPWGDSLIVGDKTEPEGKRREAALRLARWLRWPAGERTRHHLEVEAKLSRRPVRVVRDEVYSRAVMDVLEGVGTVADGGDLLVLVDGGPLMRPDGHPLTAGPAFRGVDFWEWVETEVAVAVTSRLAGLDYFPAVRLSAPPPEDGPLPLARRATASLLLPQPRRGRPPKYLNADHLLGDLGPLVRELARRCVYPSTDAVGDLAFERGLIGGEGGDPGRQVQKWVARFPERFSTYEDFLSAALQQPPLRT